MKIARLGVAIAALAIAMAPALAFHDGGVAHCNGCHTMHNSQNNESMNFAANGSTGTAIGTGYGDLLLWENKNDVCLNCHYGDDGYHVWATDVLVPGQEHGAGNFVFLEEDNINDGHGGGSIIGCSDDQYEDQATCEGAGETWDPGWANPIPGYAAGHTVVSAWRGNLPDAKLLTAPGGGADPYDARDLTCVSCHDPHGNTAFRLTYQTGQTMTDTYSGTTTWAATIVADGIGFFGPAANETNSNHNAYSSGYSDWCGTCHGDFHAASGAGIHPSGEVLGTDIALNYNLYDGTTDCVANPPSGGDPCGNGSSGTAYLAMVPFEDGAVTTSSTAGPTENSRVACVSCHRAHATSAPDAGRWDFNVTGLAEDGNESGSHPLTNPYDAAQRSLCNKCHSQDEFDDPRTF